MKTIKSVLLVEDNPGDARLLREMLNDYDPQGFKLTHVMCMMDAQNHLSKHAVDLILLDLGLPDAEGLEAIRRTRIAAPRTPLVVLTGLDDETVAALALQKGAQDYLIKGQIDTRGLLRAMRYANERKQMERLKDEFVASVSHELRTPLTSISGALGLLMAKMADGLPAPVVRLISIAQLNSQRLVGLVNDILDIETMEGHQTVFNFVRVDVRQQVEEAIKVNPGFAEPRDMRILFDKDAGPAAFVRADPGRLMQVVTNLLSNAIKFSPPNGAVEVSVERNSSNVRISVRDHGPGIAADFKRRVFERFAQADVDDARLRGGTGLGLSIVKEIVERLDGEVSFGDAPGGGTVFHVDLPCWVDAASGVIDSGCTSGCFKADASRVRLQNAGRPARAEIAGTQARLSVRLLVWRPAVG